MAKNPVPEIVREYIAHNIDSVAELEALLLIHRDPEAEWNTSALAERLYVNEVQAVAVAKKLCSLGLAGVEKGEPNTYYYRPSAPELDALVDELVAAYSKFLIPVTNLIHSKPRSKVQQFADAFKLRERSDE